MTPRRDGETRAASPGPGAYEVPLERGPEFTMGARWEGAARSQSPGPGAYETPVQRVPAFTMASRREFNTDKKNPGPGEGGEDGASTSGGSCVFCCFLLHVLDVECQPCAQSVQTETCWNEMSQTEVDTSYMLICGSDCASGTHPIDSVGDLRKKTFFFVG